MDQLRNENETEEAFAKLPPEQILLRYGLYMYIVYVIVYIAIIIVYYMYCIPYILFIYAHYIIYLITLIILTLYKPTLYRWMNYHLQRAGETPKRNFDKDMSVSYQCIFTILYML